VPASGNRQRTVLVFELGIVRIGSGIFGENLDQAALVPLQIVTEQIYPAAYRHFWRSV